MLRVILALVSAVSLTYGLLQHWEAQERQVLLAQLNTQSLGALERERRARGDLEASLKRQMELEENVARLTAERDDALSKLKKTGQEAASPSAQTPPVSETKKAGMNAFTKMFQSEEGRKMIKSQAGMVVRMQYSDLAKKLGLSPQDSDQLLALLGDRQNAMADSQFKFMGEGKFDEASAKAMAAESEAVKKEYDEKLKGILGEEKFQQFGEYEKTLGDRMMMMQHEQQFSAAGVPLQGGQKDALLQIMADERRKSPPSEFDNSGQNWGKGMSMLQDDAAIDRYFQKEGEYQQRVLNAATKTLSPDQVNALQNSFKQMQDMQRLGMKMGREMFRSGEPKTEAVPATPTPVEAPR